MIGSPAEDLGFTGSTHSIVTRERNRNLVTDQVVQYRLAGRYIEHHA